MVVRRGAISKNDDPREIDEEFYDYPDDCLVRGRER